MPAESGRGVDRLRIESDSQFELRPSEVDLFEHRTEQYDVVCASGERETGVWRGIPVGALLDRAGPAACSTHLVVTGADGYRVCVTLTAALDALLAVDRLDVPDVDSLPRFLGTAIDGTRSVKRVRQLETVALDPGEAVTDYERLQLDDAA